MLSCSTATTVNDKRLVVVSLASPLSETNVLSPGVYLLTYCATLIQGPWTCDSNPWQALEVCIHHHDLSIFCLIISLSCFRPLDETLQAGRQMLPPRSDGNISAREGPEKDQDEAKRRWARLRSGIKIKFCLQAPCATDGTLMIWQRALPRELDLNWCSGWL